MDDRTDGANDEMSSGATCTISENARRAKLNFLRSNNSPHTTIWETITIEESIQDGANTYVTERIPFDLNDYELQRPSTVDLMLNTSRTTNDDSSNDQFPSSTKSLSPKHLNRAAVFNDCKFRSNLNTNLKGFRLENTGDLDERPAVVDEMMTNMDSNYLVNDFDKFRDNRPLSPAELQLAKWKEIKRFKNQFKSERINDHHHPHSIDESFDNQQVDQSFENQLVDQSFDNQSFDNQQPIEPYYEKQEDQTLFSSSSPDQSFDQLPIDNSDYTSLDETHTRLSDLDKDTDKLDHLINFENIDQIDNQLDDQSIDELNQPVLDYRPNSEPLIDYTPAPRTSLISELNEHNYIDELSDQIDPNLLNTPYPTEDRFNYQTNQDQLHQTGDHLTYGAPTDSHQLNKREIEDEFDKLFLDYPSIEKFANNLNSPAASSPVDKLNLLNTEPQRPLDSRFQNSALDNNSRQQPPPQLNTRADLKSLPSDQVRIPSEVLEIEEPLIISRNSSRQQGSNINQNVKRRSVITVQSSRPTSLMSNDDEIQHLLTIVKNDQLQRVVPIKDVYVINRTVYQIQKLSSFLLEYRNLLDRIKTRLHRRLFSMEEANQEPDSAAKKSDKWSHMKLLLKWIIVHLFSTPGLGVLLVSYCLIGAFMFELLEQENNQNEIRKMIEFRNETVYGLVRIYSKSLSKDVLAKNVESLLKKYEDKVIDKVENNGYSGNEAEKWAFYDCFFYCVSVVTTIGYGKLSPKTVLGQSITIIYAVIGIPIMLLFITNLGKLNDAKSSHILISF